MDAEAARQAFQSNSVLLLLDAPSNLVFGIDQQVFETGPKFQGVKMVPPGVHTVTTTLAATDKPIPTVTKWLFLAQPQVYVARWDADTGRFVEVPDEDEVRRYELGVRRYDFDSGLAPYPYHKLPEWRLLTSHIHADVLASIVPPSGFVDILEEAEDLTLTPASSKAEKLLLEQLQRGRSRQHAQTSAGPAPAGPEAEGAADDMRMDVDGAASQAPCSSGASRGAGAGKARGRCTYTSIPAHVRGMGMSAERLTMLNLDKSAQLVSLFGADGKRVLAELQFAFVTFLVGQSLEGFLHWKALLTLMFSCDDAATRTHTGLFTAFLASLHAQLSLALPSAASSAGHRPNDEDAAASGSLHEPMASVGFEDSLQDLLDDSFLKQAALSFLEVMVEERQALPAELWYQSELLRKLLQETLGWDVSESDQDGPTVVDHGSD